MKRRNLLKALCITPIFALFGLSKVEGNPGVKIEKQGNWKILSVNCRVGEKYTEKYIRTVQKHVKDLMTDETPGLFPGVYWEWDDQTKERKITIELRKIKL